ncbi:glutamate ABC transporter substrate-binding protein [Amycolatopsis anabasis]|uniref:glutamate ABC transporter substrate-binding protein n=1 Tax=Amycolatopsis anabasis TaxID=1840409 RepID=UPI00131DAA66|nr:glutamate ABC transporter substrate-binding protein [Amycolatopsis anabasis]
MKTSKKLAALAAVLAVLATGCGSAGEPVDPAPVGSVQRPQPAHVGGADTKGGGPAAPNDCDKRSLAPTNGTAIADGSTMSKIKKRGKLIAAVDQTNYSFGYRNTTNGKLEGFDIDMAKQIAAAIFGTAENHIQFKAIPSSRRESVLQNGEADIVVRTYTINCERLQKVGFSSVYYVAHQRVLVSKNSPVQGLGDLGGKKVCATSTSTSLKKIATADSKPIPVSVDNWSDCLVMLQQGQVDAVSTDDVILNGMAQQDPTTHVVGDALTDEPYGIGIPKQNEDMIRYVNAVLESVRAGKWKESYNQWLAASLGDANPPAASYR